MCHLNGIQFTANSDKIQNTQSANAAAKAGATPQQETPNS